MKTITVFLLALVATAVYGQNQAYYPSKDLIVQGTVSGKIGTPITVTGSNRTIAPATVVTDVGGTGSIQRITPPSGFTSLFSGCLTLNATAAWSTVTGGNIENSITASPGYAYQACYDGSNFYFSGGSAGGSGGSGT